MSNYTVILFYLYTPLEDPEEFARRQREICQRLGLKGRLIIAYEGVNGTFEGLNDAIDEYCKDLVADDRFKNVHIKKSQGTGKAFPKLSVKVRSEIVTLGLPKENDVDPRSTTGKYLSAEQLDQWFKSGKEFTIVDMRNEYEHASGHFQGSVLPPIGNFRELPKVVSTLEPLKEKTVLTVCTGGVRCEKASGLLVKEGFKDVYQLDGGIVTYMEKFKDNQHFKGSLYVFDDRLTMAFAEPEIRGVIGKCEKCGKAAESYTNCAFDQCHRHFIACKNCLEEAASAVYCNKECESGVC